MPPNLNVLTDDANVKPLKPHESKQFRPEIVWRNVVIMSLIHLSALYGLYRAVMQPADYRTWIATFIGYILGGLGITAGAHRLWAHRSYKAKFPLRLFLAVCNSSAFQNDIIEWSRDHRVHHKFSETDADPHNAKRGFFFAHVGWLLQRKHPDVKTKGKLLSLDDLESDIVCQVQRKFYLPSVFLFGLVLPTVIPWALWNESPVTSYFFTGVFRIVFTLHQTWCVNSLAHMIGNRPYDSTINPAENLLVSLGAIGEGFHNYHHTFPSDYSSSELGGRYNLTTGFINLMAWIGQAYDLKKISPELIKRRCDRTGDGSKGIWPLEDQHCEKQTNDKTL